MTGIVNSYFRRFYPADHATTWEMEYCVGGYERRYKGDAGYSAPIFPEMVCKDGFKMSVQGHFGAYSTPRGDFEDLYSSVEVMTDAPEPMLAEFCDSSGEGTYWIYAYVPIEVIEQVVAEHGGLIEASTIVEAAQ